MATKQINLQIQQRMDTKSNWNTFNPILLNNEIGYESDTGNYKRGDGITNWNNLTYFIDFSNYVLQSEMGEIKSALQEVIRIQDILINGVDTAINNALIETIEAQETIISEGVSE